MSLFSPYILSLTLKPLSLVDSIQVLNFGRHFSQIFFFIRALIMSFHDPLNASICHSNKCDVVPSKNLRKKLSHSIVVLNPVLIQALLYSFKNTSRSSPLLPLKTRITMLNFILFYFIYF
jgi:hypothetical protein